MRKILTSVFALGLFAGPLVASAAVGSPYISSNLGFDISYATPRPPFASFGFAVVGVTRGKALVDNPKFAYQFDWAKFGSATAPTIYLNVNAPYGSTVKGNISTPKTCPANTSKEPIVCEGYNYGYNTAKHSFAYAKGKDISSNLWWLDVEEANSWSKDVAVNDAVIQGAIDYLNSQNIRVGAYSTMRMWRDIAGKGFTPTQTLNGVATPIPTWFPIGISTQIGALNDCVTRASFIPNSPVWVIQYEADSKAVDQNIAC